MIINSNWFVTPRVTLLKRITKKHTSIIKKSKRGTFKFFPARDTSKSVYFGYIRMYPFAKGVHSGEKGIHEGWRWMYPFLDKNGVIYDQKFIYSIISGNKWLIHEIVYYLVKLNISKEDPTVKNHYMWNSKIGASASWTTSTSSQIQNRSFCASHNNNRNLLNHLP